jgi:hypothetical protein
MRGREIAGPRYTWREILSRPALAVWCLYLLSTPFYVFKSGLPQPGDALVFLLTPLALIGWNGRLHPDVVRTLRPLFGFTLWVTVVNLAWATLLGTWSRPKDFLIHPLFYAYNVSVLVGALLLARPDPRRFLRLTVDMVLVTVLMQVVASLFYKTTLYRGTLFFASPNQLGYYALLSACLFAMAQRPLALGRVLPSVGVTGCAYLAVLSSSRAALAGILVLLVVLLFSNPKAILLGGLFALGLVSLGGPLTSALEASRERAESDRDPTVSFVEERGYDRIADNPEYLFLGAGEGAYGRFAHPGEPARELHSSLGTIVFGYGLVGVALFMTFAVRMVRGASLRDAVVLVPPLVYTAAHQGLRFTTFWVVVAVFMVLKLMEKVPPHATASYRPYRSF